MGVAELRQQIDALDGELLRVLNERARVVQQIGEIKKSTGAPVWDPERERSIFDRLEQSNPGPFPTESLRPVFQEIVSACLSLEVPLRVAFLGPEATFTHLACKRTFGLSARYLPAGSIAGVFDEVLRGRADLGVVPIENSTEGVVNYTLDTFMESDASIAICAEIVLEVSHSLLTRTGEMGEVDKVFSHPQALAQCRRWLAAHLPNVAVIEVASTGMAAKMAKEDPRAAAIASELAAQLYELRIAKSRIEDYARNITRFLVIGRRRPGPSGNDKTSVMFSLKNEPGILYRALQPFSELSINLTRIESRPSRRKPWEYVFFIDMDGHSDDAPVAKALERFGGSCDFVRVLGSYPRAVGPATE